MTERGNGVSAAPFASLNLGLHVRDDAAFVSENRRRVAAVLGAGLADLVCAEQVHGARVALVTDADRGCGAENFGDALPCTDALVTAAPGVLLTLFFADCLPVLFCDPTRRVVAVAHAGWRGIVAGVVENTVHAMADMGCNPADLLAAIGPGIGPCCFRVDPEVAERFPANVVTHTPEGETVNLAAAVRDRLTATGIRANRTDSCPECTSCRIDRFFSHRREGGRTGRFAGLIGIDDREVILR